MYLPYFVKFLHHMLCISHDTRKVLCVVALDLRLSTEMKNSTLHYLITITPIRHVIVGDLVIIMWGFFCVFFLRNRANKVS